MADLKGDINLEIKVYFKPCPCDKLVTNSGYHRYVSLIGIIYQRVILFPNITIYT
jgi:hypothetical protein